MRTNRGRHIQFDFEVEEAARPARRSKVEGANLAEAREAWEPIVCPECGADHPTMLDVRMKRSGTGIDARCSECGGVAAHYVSGVWSS